MPSRIPNKLLNVPDRFNPYHRAHENRMGVRHPDIRKIRNKFFKAVTLNFLVLQLLFLAMFSYIFGSLYQQSGHTHNINILFVDYDGGVIGDSIRAAYQQLQANSFPTLQERPPNGLIVPQGLRDEVCKTHYWAALYTSPGASDRLATALAGGSAATNYNKTDVVTLVWDEARYSTVADSAVLMNMQTLTQAARVAYSARNGSFAINTLPNDDPAAVAVFTNPWQLSQVQIQATTQGSRAIYNTLVFILILIQEFFYLGGLNSMYAAFKIHERLYPHRIITFRVGISCAYCFIGGLCTAGAIWAFRSGWHVNGAQFVLTWMILWLFAHLNFLMLDAFTVWLPAQLVPMALITWIVTNVTSILLPFELSPAFYKLGYALPAHETYVSMIDVWSGGCNPHLNVALPVLFAWEVLGLALGAIGVHRRNHYAVIGAEEAEKGFKERVAQALAYEKQRDLEKKEGERERRASVRSGPKEEVEEPMETKAEAEADVERDRMSMTEELRQQDSALSRIRSRTSKGLHYGPSFGFSFGDNEDD